MKISIYCDLIADFFYKTYTTYHGNYLGKNIQKPTPQKLCWRIKLKLCSIVSNISLHIFFFFIAVAQALWLLWQLKVSIDLQWEKWKLGFIAISLQMFWQKFYRNFPWVVVYQTYEFCPNRWIWMVAMAAERINLRKNTQKSSPQKP